MKNADEKEILDYHKNEQTKRKEIQSMEEIPKIFFSCLTKAKNEQI